MSELEIWRLCFIDYSKTFDCVQYLKVWNIMNDMGRASYLIQLIEVLKQESKQSLEHLLETSDWFQVKRKVRQDCVLSIYLFKINTKSIMRILKNYTFYSFNLET